MILIAKLLLSYLAGSVSGSLLLGRLRGGVDIRKEGSGNAGGTNALRTQGPLFALGVIIIDIGKGALAAGLIGPWGTATPFAVLGCAAAAVIGHIYPVWHGFRGGKGAATLVGAIAALKWTLIPVLLVLWLAIIVATGYVGLATVLAAAGLALLAVLGVVEVIPGFTTFAIAMAALILFSHRSNIRRMLAGEENRNTSLWLFGRNRREA